MHFPFRNLYLGKMPTKLGKNGQFLGGERAEIRPQNGPKKITDMYQKTLKHYEEHEAKWPYRSPQSCKLFFST